MTKKEFINSKQKIEEQLFSQYAQSKNIRRYSYTPLEHPYDAKMKSGDTYCITETKVRPDKNCAYFQQYGPFLEYKKIDGMYKEKQRILDQNGIDVTMMYFNFAQDGLQIFYLQEPWKYEFKWRLLPKDNFEPHIKIWKLVTELKNNQETIKK